MAGDESTNSDVKTDSDTKTESKLLVRPKGYVEDDPIIRQIGNRDLYLGNTFAARPKRHDRTFEYVLSATSEKHPLTTHGL